MKRVLFAVLASGLLLSSCADKNQYTIQGTVTDMEGDMAYLHVYPSDWAKPEIADSAKIVNGSFSIRGMQEKAQSALVSVGKELSKKDNNFTSVILEPGVIQLALGNESKVTGTPMNDAAYNFAQAQKAIGDKLTPLYEKYEAASDEEKAVIEKEAKAMEAEMAKDFFEYVKSNITTQIGSMNLARFSYQFSLDQLKELAGQVPAEYKTVPSIENLNKRIDILDKTKEGEKFTDVKGQNIAGKDVALSDYAGKGKYVLVDFWASWCPPCRKDMPEVVAIYSAFKKKGFEIVGISLDNEADKWEQGVKDLNITWAQMSDLKGWKSELSGAYGVNSIPHMILLDKDGKIIARGLHPSELKEKLTELLK